MALDLYAARTIIGVIKL